MPAVAYLPQDEAWLLSEGSVPDYGCHNTDWKIFNQVPTHRIPSAIKCTPAGKTEFHPQEKCQNEPRTMFSFRSSYFLLLFLFPSLRKNVSSGIEILVWYMRVEVRNYSTKCKEKPVPCDLNSNYFLKLHRVKGWDFDQRIVSRWLVRSRLSWRMRQDWNS